MNVSIINYFSFSGYVVREMERIPAKKVDQRQSDSASSVEPSQTSKSPQRKRPSLFSSYDKYLHSDTSFVSQESPSAAATVMLYLEALPKLFSEARQSDKPWENFKKDTRFVHLHPVLEKLLCVPATSAPVERIFSHGGIFMRPHRARLGKRILSELVYIKCNRHLE